MAIEERNRSVIIFSTMFMLIIYILAAVVNTTIIFADGSDVCLSMLSKKDWCLYDEMKNFGLAIRQMFAMAYLKLTDVPKVLTFIKFLSFGYTFWTSFFYILALLVCYKRKKDVLLYFTVSLITFQFCFSGFNLVLESRMAAAAFWFLVCLFNTKEELSLLCKVSSILTLFLLSRVYASVVFFSIILIVIIVKNNGMIKIKSNVYWLICLGLLAYDEILNIKFILFPHNKDARDGLIKTLTMINRDFWVLFLFWILIVLLLIIRERIHNKLFEKILNMVQILFGIIFVLGAICKSKIWASLNFPSRSLNFLIPIVIAGIVLYLEWGKIGFSYKSAIISLNILQVVGTISILVSTTGYKNYLVSLKQITSHQEGFIECSEYEVDTTGYMTTWTMPQESILAQVVNNKSYVYLYISSVIVQPKDWITWEPFDSYDIDMYPNLSEYNIFYNSDLFE